MDELLTVSVPRIEQHAASIAENLRYWRLAWQKCETDAQRQTYEPRILEQIEPRLREMRDVIGRELERIAEITEHATRQHSTGGGALPSPRPS